MTAESNFSPDLQPVAVALLRGVASGLTENIGSIGSAKGSVWKHHGYLQPRFQWEHGFQASKMSK